MELIEIALARSLGLLALVVLIYAELQSRLSASTVRRPILLGVLFGVGAIVSMLDPVHLAPGLIVDARQVLIGLSGAFGGPVSAVISVALVGYFRLSLGGVGAAPAVVGMVLAGLGGLMFRDHVKVPIAELRARDLLLLGAIISLSLLNFVLLPYPTLVVFAELALAPLFAATMLGTMVLGGLLVREEKQLAAMEQLRLAALTDPLTGLLNRRSFFDALRSRLQAPEHLFVMMLDLDHFKALNDRFGHSVGDEALRLCAEYLKSATSPGDVVARIGGEEFAIVARYASDEDAYFAAERIRAGIALLASPGAFEVGALSTSIGVTAVMPNAVPDEVLRNADQLLYAAKFAGRNRVEMDPPSRQLREALQAVEAPPEQGSSAHQQARVA